MCYTPQGSVYSISIGKTSSFTGLNFSETFNNRLQPIEIKASSTGGNAMDVTYNFVDPVTTKNAGHVYGITNNLDTTRSQNFTYDQLNRIITAQTTSTHATSAAHCWGETFSVDPWGNLQSIAATTNTAYTGCSQESGFSKTPDGNNHLSGLSYDLSGNTTNDGVNSYAWDGESQLKSAAGVNYAYDGDGRRVSKSNGKLYWYGSGSEILAETSATGTTTAEYIFFGGKRIAMLPAGSTPIYYVEDLLGTSRVTTTNAGVVCYDADFYPYGGERTVTNTCTQNAYKFEGKERDTETGNDDFGARYYSNRFGRWLSADWSAVPVPVPYANLTNPQTLNLYAMVADDPESFADLDGHSGDDDGPPLPYLPSNPFAACPRLALVCDGPEKKDPPPPTDPNAPVNVVKDLPVAGKTLNWLVDGDNIAKASQDFRDAETTQGKVGEGAALFFIVLLDLAPGAGKGGKAGAKALEKGTELTSSELARLIAAAAERYPKLAALPDQLHHVIPKYLGGAVDGLRKEIPAAYHQLITNEFRRLAPYGQKIQRSAKEVGRILQQVYSKYPLP